MWAAEADFRRLDSRDGSGDDPTDEFLVVCGVVGLGRLVAEGRTDAGRGIADTCRRTRAGGSARAWPWPCSEWGTRT